MELFDLVRTMFARGDVYEGLPASTRGRHAFMVNRIMAIKNPLQAQALNRPPVDPASLVDYWRGKVRGLGAVPGWVYTKTKKAEAKAKKLWAPEPAMAALWMDVNRVGRLELADAIALDPDGLKADIKALEKQTKE